jgi:alkylation response protein AidB-like acyl-CoA dehydrogenase
MTQFRNTVKEYLALPAQIKAEEEPIKQLKARLKEAEQEVIDFMKANGITHCHIPAEVGGGTLLLSNSVTTPAPKKDNFARGIDAFLKKRGIAATVDDVMQEVNSTREEKVTTQLKKRKTGK